MQIDIQAKGFQLTEALTAHIRKRLMPALQKRDSHIVRAEVRLSDVNGPRGGIDKCCQLLVQIAGTSSVVIRDVSSDMYTAIDRAASRMAPSINRRLGRLRMPKRPSRNRRSQIFDKTLFTV